VLGVITQAVNKQESENEREIRYAKYAVLKLTRCERSASARVSMRTKVQRLDKGLLWKGVRSLREIRMQKTGFATICVTAWNA